MCIVRAMACTPRVSFGALAYASAAPCSPVASRHPGCAVGLLVCVKVTKEILQSTGVGRVVGRLRKHEDARVATRAAEITATWKQAIDSKRERVQAVAEGAPAVADSMQSAAESSRDVADASLPPAFTPLAAADAPRAAAPLEERAAAGGVSN